MFKKRIERVINQMKTRKISQLLISDPKSIWYLCGVDVEPGERMFLLLLKENGQQVLFMNRLFPLPDTDLEIVWYTDTDQYVKLVSDRLLETSLGVDKDLPARFLLPILEAHPQISCCLGSICVDETRAVKDEQEIACMRENSLINDEVMRRAVAYITEGMSEKEVAAYIETQFKELGCQSLSFPVICSFGANGADPHHMPDDTRLKETDSIVIDIGGCKDHYCSDMTRTYFYNQISDKQKEVYDLVVKANEAAEAIIRPGVLLCDIDAAARNIIQTGGYGEYFTHRLGHFIGQSDHEYGDVSSINVNAVKPGMIFSIEPGIYLTNEFGVRIEDLVLVTEDGCEVLNRVDKHSNLIVHK